MQQCSPSSLWDYASHGNRRIGSAALTALLIAASHLGTDAATFSDDNWISMGGVPGVNAPVSATVVDPSGNLYIGGGFGVAGDVPARCVAKWNGSSWSALGPGLNGTVLALAVSGSDLYAGGWFTNSGDVSVNYIAKWNGTNWSPLGSGLNGPVGALLMWGGDLYVGGGFTMAGGAPANSIAKWNGTSWSSLDSQMNDWVTALAVYRGDLYAGGWFTTAGGIMVNRIAKWNGSSWSALGSGLEGVGSWWRSYTPASALVVSGNDLYVTGNFSTAGGITVTNIAKWDGSNWSAFPSPIYSVSDTTIFGFVNDLKVSGGELYAAGDFAFGVGGFSFATYVAKWNGSSWSAFEPGLGGSWDPYDEPRLNAVAVSGTNVYAGGDFQWAGGVTAYGIARWNTSRWSTLAPKFYSITAMTASGRDVERQ